MTLSSFGRSLWSAALSLVWIVLSFMGFKLGLGIGMLILFGLGLLLLAALALLWAGSIADAPTRALSDFMSPHEFMLYMVHEAEWGRKLGEFVSPEWDGKPGVKWGVPRPLAAVRQWAKEAQKEGSPLKAFGVPDTGGDSVLIPHTFWMTNGLDTVATLERGGPSRTEPKVGGSGARFDHVKIATRGVHEVWPRMNFVHRQMRRLRDRREQLERAKVDLALRNEATNNAPDLSGYTVLASGAIVPAPDNEQALSAQPDKVFTPAVSQEPPRPPLPEHEATLRIKALDELHAAVVPAGLALYENTRSLAATSQRVLLGELDGREKLIAAVSELREGHMSIKRAIRDLGEKHEMHRGIFPNIFFNGFPDTDRFFEGSDKYKRGLECLSDPPKTNEVTLLAPWTYIYLKDIAPFEAWLKDCAAQLKLARAETLERVR